ncbi:MAG: hypothetical protein ACIAXF_01540 [Phycisphaerales bacterium JB063]
MRDDDCTREKIRDVLVNHWDPADIAGNTLLIDEYDQYIQRIADSATKGVDSICKELERIEQDEIGCVIDVHRRHNAALLIFRLVT